MIPKCEPCWSQYPKISPFLLFTCIYLLRLSFLTSLWSVSSYAYALFWEIVSFLTFKCSRKLSRHIGLLLRVVLKVTLLVYVEHWPCWARDRFLSCPLRRRKLNLNRVRERERKPSLFVLKSKMRKLKLWRQCSRGKRGTSKCAWLIFKAERTFSINEIINTHVAVGLA
jgi:hypothetical protein